MSQRPRKPRQPKQCANPLFEQWIMEWKEEAETKNSKMKFVYAKALQSIRKYPLPLNSGKECIILDGFGAHMCKMIDNKMIQENMTPEVSLSIPVGDDEPAERSKKPGTSKRKAKVASSESEPSSRSKQRKGQAVNQPGPIDDQFNNLDIIDLTDDDNIPTPSSSPAKVSAVGKKKKQKKEYIPAFRSGGYALLLALHKKENEPDYRGYMTKTELQRDAQPYCDSSFDRPDQRNGNSRYTAWNSMAGLITKELVLKRGNPAQYFLTPEGRALAQKLASAENNVSDQPAAPSTRHQTGEDDDVIALDSTDEENMSEAENDRAIICSDVTLEPGNFEIVLYVDTCEINGRSKTQEVVNELQKNGVAVFVQRLSVGDFVWVCREIAGRGANRNRLTMSASKELVLPYVVERKRADDLAHSIRDGRYREQKHRLTQTKLHVIYLIESYGSGDWGLRDGALAQAVTNTQIVNDFCVQETSSIKDTCAYLTLMTRHIKTLYENKTLIGLHKASFDKNAKPPNPNERYVMLFNDFNDFAVKKTHWNTKEMFARHLLKLKGLSPDKAFAIVSKYPTLHDLMMAYSDCATDKDRISLLSSLHFGSSSKRIGPSISRKIFKFYNTPDLYVF